MSNFTIKNDLLRRTGNQLNRYTYILKISLIRANTTNKSPTNFKVFLNKYVKTAPEHNKVFLFYIYYSLSKKAYTNVFTQSHAYIWPVSTRSILSIFFNRPDCLIDTEFNC